jgi:hypothetical protein
MSRTKEGLVEELPERILKFDVFVSHMRKVDYSASATDTIPL